MNNISIKKKLLLYTFIVQLIVLIILAFSIYKTLDITTHDKIKSTMKVIMLDLIDDAYENKNNLQNMHLDEEFEYDFEPLYLRILKIDDKVSIVKSYKFSSKLSVSYESLKSLVLNKITFDSKGSYIITRCKIKIDDSLYILEAATNNKTLDDTLKELLYLLYFIIPIVFILSMVGGYFLIIKLLTPIENILKNLKNINANDLSKRLISSHNSDDEINQLTKEINNLLQRLEISFDKISQFSSDASHELKTPLTIMRGEIEVALFKDREVKEYKEILNSCLNEINIIQETTNDLLFLSKSEHYDIEKLKQDVYLDEISLESIEELKSFAKINDITLKSEINDLLQLKGYPELLKIAIKNILKNAIIFSHKNSNVIVRNYKEGSKIFISIQDFGIGIDKKEQKKIFDKFYRTDRSRNKNSGGTGLGMAICKKIIDIHEAKIELISEKGKGTTVLIYWNS